MHDIRDMEAEAKRIAAMTAEQRAEHDARLKQHQHMLAVIDDITTERGRQVDVERWTPEHDDEHGRGEMAMAAACYAVSDKVGTIGRDPYYALLWPWSEGWWKPKERRRDLVRAAALIVAEIERLDRRAAQ